MAANGLTREEGAPAARPPLPSGADHGSLGSYARCLRQNPHFTWLWIAECINTTGSWFKCVGTEAGFNFEEGLGRGYRGLWPGSDQGTARRGPQ